MYLAVNSSNVSSSCACCSFLTAVVLKADFAHPNRTAKAGNGALRIDLKEGLRQEDNGGRTVSRMTEVDAIERRIGGILKLLMLNRRASRGRLRCHVCSLGGWEKGTNGIRLVEALSRAVGNSSSTSLRTDRKWDLYCRSMEGIQFNERMVFPVQCREPKLHAQISYWEGRVLRTSYLERNRRRQQLIDNFGISVLAIMKLLAPARAPFRVVDFLFLRDTCTDSIGRDLLGLCAQAPPASLLILTFKSLL